MKRLLGIVLALAMAGCVRQVVLSPAPDAGNPDADTLDADGPPDGFVPDAPPDGFIPDAFTPDTPSDGNGALPDAAVTG